MLEYITTMRLVNRFFFFCFVLFLFIFLISRELKVVLVSSRISFHCCVLVLLLVPIFSVLVAQGQHY